MLLDEDPAYLYVAAVVGQSRDRLKKVKVAIGTGIAGWVAAHREPVVFDGPISDSRFSISYPRPEILSALSAPMIARNRLVGVLNVNCINKRHVFTEGQIKVSSIFTNAAAAGVEAARMYESQHRADARYREVLKMAADAIVSIDESQRVVVFNTGAENLFGYDADEIIGQPIDCLLPEDSIDAHGKMVEGFGVNQIQSKPMTGRTGLRGRRKDGVMFDAEIGVSRHVENGQSIYTAVVRDITDRHQREIAVRVAEVAESANLAKSKFLATVSHELRTPLNAIIGYSDMLADDADAMNDDRLSADLRKINGAGHHLLTLINGLLDFSRIEAGKLEITIEAFGLHAFIDDIESTVRPLVEKNKNVLVVKLDPEMKVIESDPVRLRQILFNLLSNSAKFTSSGEIHLAVHRDNKNKVDCFTVTDTGIGMSSAQLDRLFQPFEQGDASITRKYGGTGLGLAICWSLAELMGGTINVESEKDVGSTFLLQLPFL